MTENKDNITPEKFETALGRLEEILRLMEKGDLGLEEAIAHFREGSILYEQCRKQLLTAEGEIKVLVDTLDGKIEEKDFKPGETG